MSYVTREQAISALFDRLSGIDGFKTASRRMKLWSDVGAGDKPALFLSEKDEDTARTEDALLPVRMLNLEIFIYIDAGRDQAVTPATTLNNLIDAIDPRSGGVLMPHPMTGKLSLGGLVDDCFIDGRILKDPGDLDGDGVAMIPIKIVLP